MGPSRRNRPDRCDDDDPGGVGSPGVFTRGDPDRDGLRTADLGRDGSLSIRTATDADAAAAGVLHADRIAGGFLAILGPGFLTRLYRRIRQSSGCFLLVADDGERVVGFVAGSAAVRELFRVFLLHDGLAAALSASGPLLRGWRQALETLRHGRSEGMGTGRGVELLAIAVDPSYEGRGIGGELVAAFLLQVAAEGANAAYVVVAADNAGAVRLYQRAGFVAAGEFELHTGTTSVLMQWDSDPPHTAEDQV